MTPVRAVEAGSTAPALRLAAVAVALGGRTVLQGLDVTVERGELVGVIGPNGAGKTTLLRTILGLVRPSRGTVEVCGRPAGRGNRLVGYVPQSVTVEPDLPLRARDLVAMGIDGERWGISLPSRERSDRVNAMLERVDAVAYGDAPVGLLSGGERQRLLVAQAIVADPQVLLLDEPTSSLDIRSANAIVQLVRDLTTERQIASLLVAHDLNTLIAAVDKVLYLAGGRAVMGRVEDVMRADVLSELYGTRVDVLKVHGRILVVTADNGDGALLTDEHHH